MPEASGSPARAQGCDTRVAGVVLAAGASTRMGRNKLLFVLEGSTVLRRAVSRAAEAGLDPVVVVLGHEADRARRELGGLPSEIVLNPSYQKGINSSLGIGISALPENVAAAVVMLADMPFVTSEMLAALAERFRRGTAPLVISDYEGVNAPPMLYSRSLFGELLAMTGEGAGRDVVRRHRSEATIVSWPASALSDLDRPQDYERVRKQLEMPDR
ncbi:MAG: nucleotidyltransferase family protein [Gemmatimonadales bacterium]